MIPFDIHGSLFVASVLPSVDAEGLDVVLVIGGTLRIEATVTRAALEKRWRARTSGKVDDWLDAYGKNQRAIETLIATRWREGGGRVVIDAE